MKQAMRYSIEIAHNTLQVTISKQIYSDRSQNHQCFVLMLSSSNNTKPSLRHHQYLHSKIALLFSARTPSFSSSVRNDAFRTAPISYP